MSEDKPVIILAVTGEQPAERVLRRLQTIIENTNQRIARIVGHYNPISGAGSYAMGHVVDSAMYAHRARGVEFHREYLGQWVPPEESSSRFQPNRLERRRFKNRLMSQLQESFTLLTPELAAALQPNAMMPFDRDLVTKIRDPFFVERWGHLYVASIANDRVCWCWSPDDSELGGQWDDISGGTWAHPYNVQWREVRFRASVLQQQRNP